jgi:hypothetical protein
VTARLNKKSQRKTKICRKTIKSSEKLLNLYRNHVENHFLSIGTAGKFALSGLRQYPSSLSKTLCWKREPEHSSLLWDEKGDLEGDIIA